jgi:type II secretory pathway component PulF
LRAVHNQLARVLELGKPLAPALRAYAAELPLGGYRRQLRQLADGLEEGGPPESLLAKGRIAEHWVPFLCSAAAAGDPTEVLDRLLCESRRASDARRTWLRVLAYPLVLLGIVLFVLVLFSGLIAPVFEEIFTDFGTQLPGITLVVINLSRSIRATGGMVLVVPVAAIVALGVAARYLLPTAVGEATIDCIPLIGRPLRMAALSRFTQDLADLLDGGVALPETLRIAGRTSRREGLRASASRLASFVESGRGDLSDSPASARFPTTILHALESDFSPTGRAALLRELSSMYDEQARNRASWVSGFLQPAFICLIGVLVGVLFLAILAPLFSLISNLS